MREIIISDLYRDVLGPRNGPYENMREDPLNEYITGVLAPRNYVTERDPDSEAEIPSITPDDVEPFAEDDTYSDDFPPVLAHETFLDPRSRPHSMGISFNIMIEYSSSPEIRLCVTWARYFKEKNEGVWKRKPRAFITETIEIIGNTRMRYYVNGNGKICDSDLAEVSVHIISRELSPGLFHISVYLVNELKCSKDIPKTSCHIFQPQIRIKCLRGSLYPVRRFSVRDPEDRELELVYRERAALARGHMCSAVWHEVDPENIPSDIEPLQIPPFHWVDGEIIDERTRKEFTHPDVRSEFVPLLSVESPDYDWDDRWGPEPMLNAEVLAELWNPDELREALQPMVDGYERWIEELEISANNLSRPEDRKTASIIIERCKMVLERMRRGIDVLIEDLDARLAFCFANKAMDLQHRWRHGKNEKLRWRPFQLAFILLGLESLTNEDSPERDVCDILFVPTGAGKTEAYLGVAAFMLALRRRRALRRNNGSGAGTCVIMRYTLRLLTIQQFRRALRMITACEYLRVSGLGTGAPVGWRPKNCDIMDDFIWGTARFSIGLWVGGGVTPNRLGRTIISSGRVFNGALDILKGESGEGEPAQVLECPVCGTILSVPDTGLPPQEEPYMIHLLVKRKRGTYPARRIERILQTELDTRRNHAFTVQLLGIKDHGNGFLTISLGINRSDELKPEHVDGVWREIQKDLTSIGVSLELCSARASRPGYIILKARTRRGIEKPYNFNVYCPNPECDLNLGRTLWAEGRPAGVSGEIQNAERTVRAPDGMMFVEVPEFARNGLPTLAYRIPIPSLTVDEQVYTDPPSFLIGTVDKVARISFESRYGSIFGNVDAYSPLAGYYRNGAPPPSFRGLTGRGIRIEPLEPPDLIIQDELHLIEGPLGSMVGIYETALEFLVSRGRRIKYIASSATVKEAPSQVRAVFVRDTLQFPPHGLDADNRFFMRYRSSHPLASSRPGRVYMGICAPGMGPLTPVKNIWARLLQTSLDIAEDRGRDVDPFWTLVGYFNAIRELAGARSLYRQDIPERLRSLAGSSARELPEDRIVELSSRVRSTELPVLLERIETHFSGDPRNPGTIDVVFTTSMFGTGVDVPRLSLMVVHGQPKTTSSYIQSTGRVGRHIAGLVVTFYRATRPRDMSYYEMFCGYHLNLERFVEPITAAPFAPGTLTRCAGPVIVGIMRNMHGGEVGWHRDNTAHLMASFRHSQEVMRIPDIFETRAQQQPGFRRPDPGFVRDIIESALDEWSSVAQRTGSRLKYVEYTGARNPVVLGDPQHLHRGLPVVYENAPQSLRDVEETTGFDV